jgi:hypothetical protein
VPAVPVGDGRLVWPMITDYGLAGAAGTSMEDATIVLHLIIKEIRAGTRISA